MQMEKYFEEINALVSKAYDAAEKARSKGYDPEERVDILLAKDMAERVVALVSSAEPRLLDYDIPSRIKQLEKNYGKSDWRVALSIALEVAQEKFCTFESKIKAMEVGIRIGLAYLTMGIVASPLEGFVELKIKKTYDNKDYFCLMYAGPIRSAGGTAGAVSVVLADYIRKMMGYAAFDPDEREARRMATELYDYHERITNLQYLPSEDEIMFLVRHIPVQIDGDPSEDIEVSNYKDIERIKTNRIRSGPCLVLGECLAQKASKLWAQLDKWKMEFGLEHWSFLKEFMHMQKKAKSKKIRDTKDKISPVYTYIQDLVAGRPVLTHPLRNGGFRLRYGRCRNTGYSAAAIHPATMYILNKYIAIGTQLKMERPGKAAAISSCDTIEGPIIRLKNGDVLIADTVQEAKQHLGDVDEILFLGDILISFGDFFNRAHVLIPSGYCEEWWSQEAENEMQNDLDYDKLSELTKIEPLRLKNIIKDCMTEKPTAEEAILLSKALKIPLHPAYTYHWNSISKEQLKILMEWLGTSKIEKADSKIKKIVLSRNKEAKRCLELIGIPHSYVNNEFTVIPEQHAEALSFCLNLEDKKLWSLESLEKDYKALDAVNSLSPVKLRDKSGIFIGARMGRPEKAKIRKMKGDPHMLFPVGEQGGKMRSLNAALEAGSIKAEFTNFICPSCKKENIFSYCEECNTKTTKALFCNICGLVYNGCGHNASPFRLREINIKEPFRKCIEKLKLNGYPELIKGVRGTSNKDHISEHLIKGILRAKNKVYVNKDGTIRYDMTQLPITHFKPKEIGTSIEILKYLGYSKDIFGVELTNQDQVVELIPQDVILPLCTESYEDGADKVLWNISNFIDDLMVYFYGIEPFYKLKSPQELIGHLVVAVAPHTSAGIAGRIIGFSKTQCFYAHPMMHAAVRRDCDGDEVSVILLMDVLINFSRRFLPDTRGSTQDAPLVLTSKIIPAEVDDMLFDLDIAFRYGLDFYNACMEFRMPSEISVEKFISRLNTERQYCGLGYTHEVSDINLGVKCSSYKTLPTMEDKLKGQMELADKIRAVDASDVARLVIEKHLIRDIKGNLRKFSSQQFRCSKCNSKYRRPPLIGRCLNCKGNIILTVSEGAVVKYLEPAISLAEKYNLPPYQKQVLELTKMMVEGTFGKDNEKQEGLGRWFG